MTYLFSDVKEISFSVVKLNQEPITEHLLHYRNLFATPDAFIRRKVDYSKMKIITEKYRKEVDRVESFVNFPDDKKYLVDSLAKSGFYCSENSFFPDQVKCIYCQGILEDWSKIDVPMKRHKLFYPTCPFLIYLNVGNIPRITYPTKLPDIDRDIQTERTSVMKIKCRFLATKSDLLSICETIAHFDIAWRLETFEYDQALEHLAWEGLFISKDETGRFLVCCWCSKSFEILDGVENLDRDIFHLKGCKKRIAESDRDYVDPELTQYPCIVEYSVTPQEIEARSESKILYQSIGKYSIKVSKKNVKSVVERRLKERGNDFDSIYEYIKAITQYDKCPPQQSSVSVENVASVALSGFMCVVCFDNVVEIVFLPCGHLKTCNNCSNAMVTCPICRVIIVKRVKNFQLHNSTS